MLAIGQETVVFKRTSDLTKTKYLCSQKVGQSGKVRKYVVDFPDESVINSDGIIVLPHLGASTEEAEDNCAVMAAKELVDCIKTETS